MLKKNKIAIGGKIEKMRLGICAERSVVSAAHPDCSGKSGFVLKKKTNALIRFTMARTTNLHHVRHGSEHAIVIPSLNLNCVKHRGVIMPRFKYTLVFV